MPVNTGRESNKHDAASNHRVVPPHEHGRDSACILSPGSKDTGKSAQRPRRHTIMTAKQFVPEREISRLLAHPDPSREQSLAQAAVKPEICTAHCENTQPCNEPLLDCLHVEQPPRMKKEGHDIWVDGESMSSVFRFPPPIIPKSTYRFGECLEGNYIDNAKGFKMEEIGDLLKSYSKDCRALDAFVKKSIETVETLRELVSLKLETSNQIMANMVALTGEIKNHPGTEAAMSHQRTFNTLAAIKLDVDAELAHLDNRLKEEARIAVKHTEMNLLAEFDPAAANAIRRQEEEDLKTQKAQAAWAADMTKLWRVKDGPQNTLSSRKSLWQWHTEATDKPTGRSKMSTFPTFRPTRPYRPPSPELLPPAVEEVKVPFWFPILDARAVVRLQGGTPLARFKRLLCMIINYEANKREEEIGVLPKKTFTKEWHDADSRWPHPVWRTHGGWWICRSGPEASEAERQCQICHPAPIPANASQRRARPGISRQTTNPSVKKAAEPRPAKINTPELSEAELYERLMDEIEDAMDECFVDDKMALHGRMEMQRQLNEALDRVRLEEEAAGGRKGNIIRVLELGPDTDRRHRG